MKVTVHLHSSLQVQTDEGPKRVLDLEMEEGAVLKDIITTLALEIDPGQLLLGINGEIARLEDPLRDGDHVHLMLPISGG